MQSIAVQPGLLQGLGQKEDALIKAQEPPLPLLLQWVLSVHSRADSPVPAASLSSLGLPLALGIQLSHHFMVVACVCSS